MCHAPSNAEASHADDGELSLGLHPFEVASRGSFGPPAQRAGTLHQAHEECGAVQHPVGVCSLGASSWRQNGPGHGPSHQTAGTIMPGKAYFCCFLHSEENQIFFLLLFLLFVHFAQDRRRNRREKSTISCWMVIGLLDSMRLLNTTRQQGSENNGMTTACR